MSPTKYPFISVTLLGSDRGTRRIKYREPIYWAPTLLIKGHSAKTPVNEAMHAKELVAGTLLGAGTVLLLLALILYHYSASLTTSNWNKTIANYTELLSRAEKIINEINKENITTKYAELVNTLPSLEQALKDYGTIYNEAIRHKEILVQAYEMTHSKDYNDTIKQLEKLAKKNNTLISLLLGPALQRLANYMKQAQPLTAEALKILKAIEENPPQRVKQYLDLAEKIIETMPPTKLNKTLAEAEQLITKAKQVLNNTQQTRINNLKEKLRDYAASLLIIGSSMITAAAIILYSTRREATKITR